MSQIQKLYDEDDSIQTFVAQSACFQLNLTSGKAFDDDADADDADHAAAAADDDGDDYGGGDDGGDDDDDSI